MHYNKRRLFFFLGLSYISSIQPVTILGDLALQRALVLAQQPAPHTFVWAPFIRSTKMQTPTTMQKVVFSGAAFRYTYYCPLGFFDITTALAGAEFTQQQNDTLTTTGQFHFDDILFAIGHDFVDEEDALFSLFFTAGVPTTKPRPDGLIVGTGHSSVSVGWNYLTQLPLHIPGMGAFNFISTGLLLHTFERTVFLNKKLKLLPSSESIGIVPSYKEKFNLGDIFLGIAGFQYHTEAFDVEVAYDVIVVYNVHNKITPLVSQARITPEVRDAAWPRPMGGQIVRPLTPTPKTLVIHKFYTQSKVSFPIHDYSLTLVAGISYGFGNIHSLKRGCGWMAMSVDF